MLGNNRIDKLFTIVVCTYNGERYLERCLSALENLIGLHEYTDKIYVVDNNSTDKTADIIKSYCKRDELFEYFFEKRQGISYAREYAVNANTEWVIYVDDDNILDSHWLVELKRTVESDARLGIINGAVIAIPESELNQKQHAILKAMYRNLACTHYREPEENDTPNTSPMGAGMCVRSAALKKIEKEGWLRLKGREGKKLSSGEDTELSERVFLQGYCYKSNFAMKLYHIIPKGRLEEDYVIRLIDGLVLGRVAFLRNQKLGYIKCLMRKAKYKIIQNKELIALNKKDISIDEYWRHKIMLYQAQSFLDNL